MADVIIAAAPGTVERVVPMPFRGGGFEISPRRWGPPLFFILLLGIWQLASDMGWINALFLPSSLVIVEALYRMTVTCVLWDNLQISLIRLIGGWIVGAAAGLLVGFAMGISSLARSVSLAAISALFPIPKIALLPLLILWLGIGEASKVATIALGVFFPMAIATYTAIDAVPRNLIRMGQSFGLSWFSILRKIIIPGSIGGILAGVRITISISITLLVAAEMIGANLGIGAFLLTAGNLMQTDQLMSGMVVLSILGLIFGWLVSVVEKRVFRWR